MRATHAVALAFASTGALAALWLALGSTEPSAAAGVTAPRGRAAAVAPAHGPSARAELGGTAEPVQRVLVDPGSAPGAHARDVTLLRVRVVAPDGAPIRSGFLECASAVSFADDAALAPFRVQRAIEGDVTEFEIPVEVYELQVTASSIGRSPGVARVDRLRLIDGRRRLEGTIIEEVAIELGRQLEGPALVGSILVDGRARVPDALSLELQRVDGDTMEHCQVVVDLANSSYSIAPLPAGDLFLLANSDETSPAWIRVPSRRPAGTLRQDIALTSGITVELAALDSATRRSVAGARLRIDCSIPTWRSQECQGFDGRERIVVTDPAGLALVRGIPRPGTLAVSAWPPPGPTRIGDPLDQGSVLLELDTDADTPDFLREVVTLRPDSARDATVWGPAPAEHGFPVARANAELRVVAEIRTAAGVDRREAQIDAHRRWSLQVAVPSVVLAWVERDRRRVSRVEQRELNEVASVGPLEFAALELAPLTLVSRGGERGSRIEVLAVDAQIEERIDAFVNDAREIERALPLPGACTLVLRSLAADGRIEQRSLAVDPALQQRVEIEWDGSEPVTLRAMLDGAPFDGAGDVLLQRLSDDPAAAEDTRAVQLEAGRSSALLRLAGGRYFFRIDRALEGSLVCGVLEVGARSPGDVWLVWSGERAEFPADARAVELTHCGAVDIGSRVPLRFRRVPLDSSSSSRGYAGPRSLRMPRGCSWSVVR